jgi:hypothetical protein
MLMVPPAVSYFTNFSVKLHIYMFLLTNHDSVLETKTQLDNHVSMLTWLKECIPNSVQTVCFVTPHWSVLKPTYMCFQWPYHTFGKTMFSSSFWLPLFCDIKRVICVTRFFSPTSDTNCHVIVTEHGVWTDNWIYWTFITRNYNQLQ